MPSKPRIEARRIATRAAVLCLAVFGATAAFAQASDTMIRETAGSYQIVPTDGKPACTIQLGAARTGPNAWRATPAACPHVPALATVTGWRLIDGTALLDAKGRTVMQFVEDETALPSYPDLQTPRLYLVPSIAGFTHLLQPAEWIGSWKLLRRGKPVCTITLAATATGPGESSRRLSVAACPRASPAARLSSWSVEDMKLMLWGPDDQLLAFDIAPAGRWVAEPGGWSLSK